MNCFTIQLFFFFFATVVSEEAPPTTEVHYFWEDANPADEYNRIDATIDLLTDLYKGISKVATKKASQIATYLNAGDDEESKQNLKEKKDQNTDKKEINKLELLGNLVNGVSKVALKKGEQLAAYLNADDDKESKQNMEEKKDQDTKKKGINKLELLGNLVNGISKVALKKGEQLAAYLNSDDDEESEKNLHEKKDKSEQAVIESFSGFTKIASSKAAEMVGKAATMTALNKFTSDPVGTVKTLKNLADLWATIPSDVSKTS